MQSFEQLTELEPEWGMPWLMRGLVLGNMGLFVDRRYHEEALVALDRALTLDGLRDRDCEVAASPRDKSLSCLGRLQDRDAERWAGEQPQRRERTGAEPHTASSCTPRQLHG